MSNEELVELIQNGEPLMGELWTQVERFVGQQASRRATSWYEDLYQSGYLALVAAVESYHHERGKSFIGWLALHLRTAFNEAQGYQSAKQRQDPIHQALSFELPLGEEDADKLGDRVADPLNHFEEAENCIWQEELHKAVEEALGTLPMEQSSILRRRYYLGQTRGDTGAALALSATEVGKQEAKALKALRHPKVCQRLRAFVEGRTPYYLHVGVARFHATGSSAVDEIAMARERLQEQWGASNLRQGDSSYGHYQGGDQI